MTTTRDVLNAVFDPSTNKLNVAADISATVADVITVTGGAGQTADVKVTLDSEAVVLGAGTAGIGKLTANSGVDIGDVDVASIAAGTNSIGGTKDNGPHWTTVWGISGARFTSANQSGAEAAVSDAPTAGQKLVITDIIVSADTAMRVDFSEEDSAGTILSLYLPANGSAQITPRSKFKLATADKQLMVQTSAAGNIAVTAFYFSEL